MKENKEIEFKHKIGDIVFILEYDEEDVPTDLSGYILLMFSRTHALLSPMMNGCSDPVGICEEHYSAFREYEESCDCVIVPLAEIYTREEAEKKLLDKGGIRCVGSVYHAEECDDTPAISSDLLDYIAEHNDEPLDFVYALKNQAVLSDEVVLDYLTDSFGYKYSETELREVIKQYHRENN